MFIHFLAMKTSKIIMKFYTNLHLTSVPISGMILPMKCLSGLALALLPLCQSIAIYDGGRGLPEGSNGLPVAGHRPGWLARKGGWSRLPGRAMGKVETRLKIGWFVEKFGRSLLFGLMFGNSLWFGVLLRFLMALGE